MSEPDNPDRYDDMLNLPHHVSTVHPHRSIADRAAQFSPFAALTGYEAAIEETARITDKKFELDESRKSELNDTLQTLREHLSERRRVKIVYFRPDKNKEGGSYNTVTGIVHKIDMIEHTVNFENGIRVPAEDIFDIVILPESVL